MTHTGSVPCFIQVMQLFLQQCTMNERISCNGGIIPLIFIWRRSSSACCIGYFLPTVLYCWLHTKTEMRISLCDRNDDQHSINRCQWMPQKWYESLWRCIRFDEYLTCRRYVQSVAAAVTAICWALSDDCCNRHSHEPRMLFTIAVIQWVKNKQSRRPWYSPLIIAVWRLFNSPMSDACRQTPCI